MEKVKKYNALFFLFCLVMTVSFPCSLSSQTREETKNDRQVRVLYVNSYHPGYAWSDEIYRGIRTTLRESFGYRLHLFVEYLDAKRYGRKLSGPLGYHTKRAWLQKYSKLPPHLILVSDQPGYDFLAAVRSELFPGIPLVFTGVEEPGKLQRLTTGVIASTDYQGNFRLIRRVLSKCGKIWVICDDSTTGRITRRQLLSINSAQPDPCPIAFLPEKGKGEKKSLLEKIRKLPPDDAVFFLHYSISKDRKFVNTADFIESLCRISPVPVFSHVDLYMQYGVTGGMMNSGFTQGCQIANVGTRMLRNRSGRVPGPEIEMSRPIFLYSSLLKYGIPLSRLPDKSRVQGKPENILDRYFFPVIGIVLFLVLQTILIFSLHRLYRRQKDLRRKAREGEEKFRALLDLAPFGCTVNDMEGKYILVNQVFCSNRGFSQAEVLGKTTSELGTIIDEDASRRVMNELKEKGAVSLVETKVQNRNGDVADILYSSQVITYEGQPAILSASLDISDLKRTESELAKSQKRYEDALAATSDAIWDWDLRTNETYFSPRWYEMLGYHDREFSMSLKTWEKLCHPDDKPRVFKIIEDTITDAGTTGYIADFRMKRKDENWHWIRGRGNITEWDEEGKPVVFSGTHTDINSEVEAREERRKLEAQIQQSQKIESLGRLAGGVAHDFNNMLGVILGYTEMALKRVEPGERLYHQISEIRKAAHRSAELTRQLLAFSRQQPVAPRIFDVNESVSGMMKLLQRLIGEDIKLVWEPGDVPWYLKIDPSQFDQVVANLCINARDAISANGKIIIRTGSISVDDKFCTVHPGMKPGDFIMLAVDDNGSGMDTETQQKIFDPFFSTKAVGEGTGLGLATVHGVVSQNGGFINVYSEPGRGTSFKIYLPRAPRGAGVSSASEEVKIEKGQGEVILFVEDNPQMRAVTGEMLVNIGYKILEAEGPGDALRIVSEKENEIDLLLTDIIMPEYNGYELAEKIRETLPGIGLLYMSGYTANIISPQGINSGEINFIEKPFSLSQLAAALKNALEKKN